MLLCTCTSVCTGVYSCVYVLQCVQVNALMHMYFSVYRYLSHTHIQVKPMTREMFFVAGGIIIVGGISDITGGNAVPVSSTEGLGMEAPPAIPFPLYDFPLVLVGSKLFMCGGRPYNAKTYYTLDTDETTPQWQQTHSLPVTVRGHMGVARAHTNIWFVTSPYLLDYNTTTGITQRHAMPFYARYHCVVGNDSYTYVVGVGRSWDEIWFNSNVGDPSSWTFVTRLPIRTAHMSCVWFQETIHIQGGFSGTSFLPLKDAFALDVNSHSLRRVANMTTARVAARAAVLDNKPAVIGGGTQNATGPYSLPSIETYDATNNAWTPYEPSLDIGRHSFGLVQFKN